MNLINGSKQNWVFTGVVVITFWLWTGNAVYGQVNKPTVLLRPQRTTILSAGCTVSRLQLRFRTGNDDLRGGQKPVLRDQIAGAILETTFGGGSNGDNWNMNSVQIAAITEKGTNFPIATSGFHRFSADLTGPKARRLTISVK